MLNKDDMKEQESEKIRLKLKTEVNTNSQNPSQIPPVISTPIVNNQTAQNLNPNPVVINTVPLVNNDIQGFVPIMKPKQFGSKPISTLIVDSLWQPYLLKSAIAVHVVGAFAALNYGYLFSVVEIKKSPVMIISIHVLDVDSKLEIMMLGKKALMLYIIIKLYSKIICISLLDNYD